MAGTSGAAKTFPPRADFFSPLCIEHVYENHPELIGALGLAKPISVIP
jgi:hypothetical protein